MSEEYQKAQAELVSGHIAKQDIVVITSYSIHYTKLYENTEETRHRAALYGRGPCSSSALRPRTLPSCNRSARVGETRSTDAGAQVV